MTTTVYFGTNRVVNQPPTAVANYTFNIISPTRPQDMTYGTAFVDSAGLTADTVGAIRSIQDLNKGGFTQEIVDDLSAGGRNTPALLPPFPHHLQKPLTPP